MISVNRVGLPHPTSRERLGRRTANRHSIRKAQAGIFSFCFLLPADCSAGASSRPACANSFREGSTRVVEWSFAQNEPSEELCMLASFRHEEAAPSGDVEFLITVREYGFATRSGAQVLRASRQTDQPKYRALYTIWVGTIAGAGAHRSALRRIHRFPYEPAG